MKNTYFKCAKQPSACVYVKINIINSLEKLQDGGNHLCYGVHGGILVTATENTQELSLMNHHNILSF